MTSDFHSFLTSQYASNGAQGILDSLSFLNSAFVLLEKGKVRGVSNKFCKLLQFDESELIGMDALLLASPEIRSSIEKRWKNADLSQVQISLLSKSSELIPVIVLPVEFDTGAGKIRLLEIVDISVQVQAQEKLFQANLIYSNTQDMMALVDRNYVYLSANKAYCRAFELENSQLLNKTIEEVFGQEFFSNVIRPPADRCLNGETVNYQEWFDFPNTGRRFMDITYSPYSRKTSTIDGFIVAAHDITKQKELGVSANKISHQLVERIKEQRCLYSILDICSRGDINSKETQQQVFAAIKQGWQYPELTCVRLALNENSLCTGDFEESESKLVRDIIVDGAAVGLIEVFYCGEAMEFAENIFLKEEESLISQISVILGDAISDTMRRTEAENLRIVVESSHVVLFVWKAEEDWPVEYVSKNVTQFGYSSNDFLSGKLTYDAIIHPLDVARVTSEVRSNSDQKIDVFTQEYRIVSAAGKVHWVNDRTSIRSDSEGNITHYQGVILDITERKISELRVQRSDRALKSLVHVNRAIIYSESKDELFQETCATLIEAGNYLLVWIGLAENDKGKSVTPISHRGYDEGYIESLHISWGDNPRGQGPIGLAIRNKNTVVAKDIQNDPNFAPWRDAALDHGYHSSITLPLMNESQTYGVVNIYSADIDAFDSEEIHLLEEMAANITYGIHNKDTELEKQDHLKQLSESLVSTVHAVALTVEKRDPYTAGHMDRVAELAVAIGKKLNFPESQLEGLALGATIHDIGKIYVPAEILNRPGKLSKAEFEIVKNHSQVGYDIIKDIKFPWPIADMILSHHERLDGSGYPNGLKGDEICLEAQILAVADIVEAISSHRPYRAAIGIKKSLEIIVNERGTKLNPEAVDACIELVNEDGFTFSSSF